MSESDLPEFFADNVQTISVVDGVFRLTMTQQEANESQRAVARILIPATQLPAILQGLESSVAEIGDKIREQMETEASPPETAESEVPVSSEEPEKGESKSLLSKVIGGVQSRLAKSD